MDRAESRILGQGERVKMEVRPISTLEFVETPYVDTAWEIVGTRATILDFAPMELSVVKTAVRGADPMFEHFGADRVRAADDAAWHLPVGERPDKPEAESQGGIDEETLMRMLEEKLEEGRKLGAKEGYERAQLDIVEKYEVLAKQRAEFEEKLNSEVTRFLTNIERQSVKLAVSIAKKILDTTTHAKPEYIVEVIRVGLKSLGAAYPIRIRVSPEDLEFIQIIGLPPELSSHELGVEYVADEGLTSGCVIETDYGEVDLEIDRMWEQVAADLFEVSK